MAKANSRAKPKCIKPASVCKGGSSKPCNKTQISMTHKYSSTAAVLPQKNMGWLLENGEGLRAISSRVSKHTNKAKEGMSKLNNIKKSKGRKNETTAKKNKNKLELFSNILKSELLIKDTNSEPALNNISSEMFSTIDTSHFQDSNSTEITNGISSPESLDSNSNRIKRKSKPDKPPNNRKAKPKTDKAKVKKKRNPQIEEITFSNGLVLTLSLFQCDYCQKSFSTKSSLRRHIYTHLGIKRYSCNYCHKSFSQLTNLKGHAERKHLDAIPNYTCNQCHKPFQLKKNLALHIQTHQKVFKCVFCDMIFSHQILLSQHEKLHLRSGRFHCSICSISYDCRSQLSLHVKKHLNIKDYVCQYCGKEFLRPNSIKRHIEICHSGFRIQCPICLKHLKGHLTEHLRTHENKRPHECPDCGQRFTQATQLTVHRRSHTGARPYPCRICDRPFSHSNALMLHIRRHTGEKPFPCAMCPNSFSQLPHMKAHMKKIHGKEAPYKCPKCDEFYKLKAALEEHVKSCKVGDRELSFEEQVQASLESVPEVESGMSLSRMRFLLALLLTMIATKEKLKYLGFNKRLIDDLLIESLEAMGQNPCKDQTQPPLRRLKANIQILLNGTVPPDQMEKFRSENRSTEELLEILTGEKKH